MALLSDPPPRLSGGVVFDPYGTGLGGPNPLSVWGPGLVGSPTPAVEGGLQQQTPRSVVFNPVQDPSATTFGAGVTPPTGFTVPPDKPDPAAEAAKQAAEQLNTVQTDLKNYEANALRTEEAMGAKLGDWQSYMAATMKPFQP